MFALAMVFALVRMIALAMALASVATFDLAMVYVLATVIAFVVQPTLSNSASHLKQHERLLKIPDFLLLPEINKR